MPTSRQLLGATLLVGLTNNPESRALTNAALARRSTDSIAATTDKQITKIWQDANTEALNFLNLVLGNNNTKTPNQVLARPDVQQALRTPYEEAAAKSEAILRKAWSKAAADALEKGRAEAKSLGLDARDADPEFSEDLLDAVISDMRQNAKAMRGRVKDALNSPSGQRTARLRGTTDDVVRRARYSAHTALWGVSGLVKEGLARLLGISRMWVAVLDSKTCQNCLNLHGTVVAYKDPFPIPHGFKVYLDVLHGSPLHVGCRCQIVLTLAKPNVTLVKSG